MAEELKVTKWQPTERPYLLYIRAGDSPDYLRWLDFHKPRLWDLLVCYHTVPADGPDLRADMVAIGGFNKLGSFAELERQRQSFFESYKAVAMFDDDLLARYESIDQLFVTVSHHQLQLAQPTLTFNSAHSFKETLTHPSFYMRFTSYVEVMMPVFSTSALKACIPTFLETKSTWGADLAWSSILGRPTNRIAYLDDIALRHTKPIDIRSGPFYRELQSMGVDPFNEKKRMMEKYGVDDRIVQYGAIMKAKDGSLTWVSFEPR